MTKVVVEAPMSGRNWTVADAKAKFSEVIERAKTEGPQYVTKNGKDAVVVVSFADWLGMRRPSISAADVLLHPSVRGLLTEDEAKLFERDRDLGRPPPKF